MSSPEQHSFRSIFVVFSASKSNFCKTFFNNHSAAAAAALRASFLRWKVFRQGSHCSQIIRTKNDDQKMQNNESGKKLWNGPAAAGT